jgi:hypothetical protein
MRHHREHHRCHVYKIFIKRKRQSILTTPEQALDIIRQVHDMSAGMPQIVYLVGWQHDGHDSNYPDWSEINPVFKRPEDATPLQSIGWLSEQARAFSASVSVHINLDDAYESSPLWHEYLSSGLLIQSRAGELEKGGWWDGEQSYHINKTAEWKSGRLKKRLDLLLDMLPVRQAGSIHIDTFRPHPSPDQGVSYDDDLRTCLDICEYLHERGVDVTSEYVGDYALAGPIAWAWAYNFDEYTWSLKQGVPAWTGSPFVPAGGCRFDQAWGSTAARDLQGPPAGDFDTPEKYFRPFFEQTVPCHFLDQEKTLSHSATSENYVVQFSNGITSRIRMSDELHTIEQNGRLILSPDGYLLPARWCGDDTLVAYNATGESIDWKLPDAFHKRTMRLRRLLPSAKSEFGPPVEVDDMLRIPAIKHAAWLVQM